MQIRAGVKTHFDKFGVMNIIDALANGDMLRWEKVEMQPYNYVFTKLLMNKEQVLYQRKLRRVQQEEENKRNRKK